jgi:hypothetical protein
MGVQLLYKQRQKIALHESLLIVLTIVHLVMAIFYSPIWFKR